MIAMTTSSSMSVNAAQRCRFVAWKQSSCTAPSLSGRETTLQNERRASRKNRKVSGLRHIDPLNLSWREAERVHPIGQSSGSGVLVEHEVVFVGWRKSNLRARQSHA